MSAAARILRDDLLAQLRVAGRPLTTAQLCRQAPRVPTPGAAVPLPPLREQVYRILCTLRRDDLVTRTKTPDRFVAWAVAPGPADDEIAALEAVLATTTAGHRD